MSMTMSTTGANANANLPRVKRHHNFWVLVLLAVCVPAVIVGSAFSEGVNQLLPETLPNPTTYNKKASGYSALYELCEKAGLSVKRWELPYRRLSASKQRGTLVLVLPWDILDRADVDYITNWVEKGNDFVYLDYFTYKSGQKLLDRLNVDDVAQRKGAKEQLVELDQSVPQSQHINSGLKVTSEVKFKGGNTLADGYFTEVRLGKGRVLIGSVPDLCSNKHIADPAYRDNFQFMINWLSSSRHPILFDEKAHGYSSGANVFFFILKSPVGFILLQLAIIALVALISLNQRFGAAKLVSNPRKISNLEFIDGLASTYERARARDAAWAMMFNPLHSKLCRTLGVAPDAPDEELAAAWSESSGKPRVECAAFLEKSRNALARQGLTSEELQELVTLSDKLTAESRELQPVRRIMGA